MVQNEKLNMPADKSYHMNQKHKDCLFRIAFREKEQLLELYNAINDSDYKDPSELTVYTMEDVVFMGIKNDISFLVGEMLNLYEHQSTTNPNMPVRGLMYFARNYESYIARNDLDIFSRKLQKLPFPQYYVLYNGQREEEERRVMELKEAFPKLEGIEPCLNCTATLLNINYGHNQAVMRRSKTLRDYSDYIQRIRDYKASGMDLPQAVDKATEECIREGILRDILLKNSAEVKHMVLGTWGTENHIRKQQEEQERIEKENEKLKQERKDLRQMTDELRKEKNELRQETEDLRQEKNELRQEAEDLRQETDGLRQEKAELMRRKEAEDILIKKLLDAGRVEELKKALADGIYRQKLLEEYQLFS